MYRDMPHLVTIGNTMPSMIDTLSPPTAFAATSSHQHVGCRVCGRTLLLGERSIGYFTATGEGPFDVCELCAPKAYRYGLRSQPYSPEEITRTLRGGMALRASRWLRKLVSRSDVKGPSIPVVQGSAVITATTQNSKRRSMRRRPQVALDSTTLGTVPVGTAAIGVAIAAFNQSSNSRTLAGLYRTLGAPRASVTPRSATDREVILTVAWEIVWYQFRIMPDAIAQERGQYLSDLQDRWKDWNCIVGPAGTVTFTGDDLAEDGNSFLDKVTSQTEVAPR